VNQGGPVTVHDLLRDTLGMDEDNDRPEGTAGATPAGDTPETITDPAAGPAQAAGGSSLLLSEILNRMDQLDAAAAGSTGGDPQGAAKAARGEASSALIEGAGRDPGSDPMVPAGQQQPQATAGQGPTELDIARREIAELRAALAAAQTGARSPLSTLPRSVKSVDIREVWRPTVNPLPTYNQYPLSRYPPAALVDEKVRSAKLDGMREAQEAQLREEKKALQQSQLHAEECRLKLQRADSEVRRLRDGVIPPEHLARMKAIAQQSLEAAFEAAGPSGHAPGAKRRQPETTATLQPPAKKTVLPPVRIGPKPFWDSAKLVDSDNTVVPAEAKGLSEFPFATCMAAEDYAPKGESIDLPPPNLLANIRALHAKDPVTFAYDGKIMTGIKELLVQAHAAFEDRIQRVNKGKSGEPFRQWRTWCPRTVREMANEEFMIPIKTLGTKPQGWVSYGCEDVGQGSPGWGPEEGTYEDENPDRYDRQYDESDPRLLSDLYPSQDDPHYDPCYDPYTETPQWARKVSSRDRGYLRRDLGDIEPRLRPDTIPHDFKIWCYRVEEVVSLRLGADWETLGDLNLPRMSVPALSGSLKNHVEEAFAADPLVADMPWFEFKPWLSRLLPAQVLPESQITREALLSGKMLQNGKPVNQYYLELFHAFTRIPDITEAERLAIFVHGLRSDLRKQCQWDDQGRAFNTVHAVLQHAKRREAMGTEHELTRKSHFSKLTRQPTYGRWRKSTSPPPSKVQFSALPQGRREAVTEDPEDSRSDSDPSEEEDRHQRKPANKGPKSGRSGGRGYGGGGQGYGSGRGRGGMNRTKGSWVFMANQVDQGRGQGQYGREPPRQDRDRAAQPEFAGNPESPFPKNRNISVRQAIALREQQRCFNCYEKLNGSIRDHACPMRGKASRSPPYIPGLPPWKK
jgi:hypothetical protein